jgi:hypothetical protein
VVKRVIQGIVFLVVASITELALAQACPQSTATISPTLQDFQKCQSCTVVYAWTGAHYFNGGWTVRANPNDAITFSSTGARVAQTWNSSFPHGASSDASNASASAECSGLNCATPVLSTSACVTSKFDSAGAGAYARAGLTVPAQSKTAKKSTVIINIPNRMTLYSNVGDESGVWGVAVSVAKVAGQKPLVDKGHPDIAPFLVDLLGLKDEKQFKVHSANQRTTTFAAGFEFGPRDTSVKLIELVNMTDEQRLTAKAALATLHGLTKKFVISPCKPIGDPSMNQLSNNCRTAEYLAVGEPISINAPYEFPDEPEASKSDQILYIEVGQGGRDVVQSNGAIDSKPTSP